ncbi:hypothetical protein IQR32_06215 [Acinetobacter albensis]|uniref:hypothetical protein n=1 Tax=Acinetobacter albensis TaxID=1673609 RepID=UPI00187E6096|nr:hypothetical protein [Acinetobacter albensis]MBE9400949.1 hypothetical protein [Acinetobacter albensis]
MKKIILALALSISASAFAVSVDSVRGGYGFVERGHSYSKMIDVLGNPDSSYSHIIHDRNGWPHKAVTYSYSLNNARYEITVVDGAVYSINWERA